MHFSHKDTSTTTETTTTITTPQFISNSPHIATGETTTTTTTLNVPPFSNLDNRSYNRHEAALENYIRTVFLPANRSPL